MREGECPDESPLERTSPGGPSPPWHLLPPPRVAPPAPRRLDSARVKGHRRRREGPGAMAAAEAAEVRVAREQGKAARPGGALLGRAGTKGNERVALRGVVCASLGEEATEPGEGGTRGAL